MANCMCDDLLVRILRILPVRTILQCRCVSKSMKRLIDSQFFRLHHLSLQHPRFICQSGFDLNQRRFLVLDSSNPPFLRYLGEPVWMNRLFLIGTLHGVVCLYEKDFGLRFWNPSIRKISHLHYPTLPTMMHLRWEYLPEEFYYSGFWLDPATKEFKVIMFRFWCRGCVMRVALYRSNEARWVTLAEQDQGLDGIEGCRVAQDGPKVWPAVMIGDVAYWMVFRDSISIGDEGVFVLSFDFVQDSFDWIKMPVQLESRAFFDMMNVARRQGRLSLVYWHYDDHRCELYSRQDDGLWACVHSFNLDHSIWEVREVFWVIEEMEGGGRALASTEDELILYDSRIAPLVNVLKEVDWGYYCFSMAYDFVESLVFP